ncbi:META domain-containing protein [Halorhodospira halophila]|uniref:DUF306 domain-containing protein n=1 Tax=Halorhodospira halophila (strain DSM 244 / SL1) TaxID=349124 RepID=A1WVZ7_HALHL|nr:META domain-containing protein [Halorhodospira halophila]ABM61859.1 protein of unknown function DUF306, Meta and HslJ [Halorhodospira halophila SL1]MBK1729845.1 META domain-containing protein [Halorhodospira halophila]
MTALRTFAPAVTVWLMLLLLAACAAPEQAPDAEVVPAPEETPPAPSAESAETPDTAPEPAPGLGTVDQSFVARGQEPGWMLRMDGEQLRLLADYGQVEVTAEQPAPETTDAGQRYTAETDDGRSLEVVVEQALCADLATGMPHPYRVHYQLDGEGHRGCGGDPHALLTDGGWQIVAVDGQSPETVVTLSFDCEGRVHGQAPCNRYLGGYRLTGERIVFSGLAATRMACSDADLTEAEQRYLGVLADVHFLYMPDEDRLRLMTADGRRLEAIRTGAEGAP